MPPFVASWSALQELGPELQGELELELELKPEPEQDPWSALSAGRWPSCGLVMVAVRAVVEFVVVVETGLGKRQVRWGFDLMLGLGWEEPEQVTTGSGARVSVKYLGQPGQRGEEDVGLSIPRPALVH